MVTGVEPQEIFSTIGTAKKVGASGVVKLLGNMLWRVRVRYDELTKARVEEYVVNLKQMVEQGS